MLIICLLCAAACLLALLLPKKQLLLPNLPEGGRVVLTMVASRIALLLALLALLCARFSTVSAAMEWLASCGDVPHYIHLAQAGYSVGDEYENLIVFYPLFPMLLRAVQTVVRNYYIAGVLISNACSIGAAVYLYKLYCIDEPEARARRAALLLFAYPFAFFTLLCYTEGLFLFVCAASAYYARRGKWLFSGLFGFLAALCRTQGVLIFGFALYEFLLQTGEAGWKKPSPKGLFLLLTPCGTAAYLGLNAVLFGNPLQFLQFQKAAPWYNSAGFFADNLAQNYDMAMAYYPGLAWVIYIPQLVLFFLAFALVLYGIRKRIRTSYLLHAAVYTLISFSPAWLISGPRYMLSCLFLGLPLAYLTERKTVRAVVYLLLGAWFAFYFVLYAQGHAIM